MIEQWLHVGLYLYPIETIAQQLWTVAYSYALRVLQNHPGHHLHSPHPATSLDTEDEDYHETHPFTLKFNNDLHPIPMTHSRLWGQGTMRFVGATTTTLYRRFRNLMRLRGILHSIIFVVRTHLSAIRRRAYTDVFTDALREPTQALPSISTAIIPTIRLLNTRYTLSPLFTIYPAPYKNPTCMTTLEVTQTPPSNIHQGDPLAHLLHNTYHYDHRQFTISPHLAISSQLSSAADLAAIYADLIHHPTPRPPHRYHSTSRNDLSSPLDRYTTPT